MHSSHVKTSSEYEQQMSHKQSTSLWKTACGWSVGHDSLWQRVFSQPEPGVLQGGGAFVVPRLLALWLVRDNDSLLLFIYCFNFIKQFHLNFVSFCISIFLFIRLCVCVRLCATSSCDLLALSSSFLDFFRASGPTTDRTLRSLNTNRKTDFKIQNISCCSVTGNGWN